MNDGRGCIHSQTITSAVLKQHPCQTHLRNEREKEQAKALDFTWKYLSDTFMGFLKGEGAKLAFSRKKKKFSGTSSSQIFWAKQLALTVRRDGICLHRHLDAPV